MSTLVKFYRKWGHAKLYKVFHKGSKNFKIKRGGKSEKISCVSFGSSFFFSLTQGLFVKQVKGQNDYLWTPVNNGLYGGQIYSLAIDPTNTQIIYAGTYGCVFKSTNGGSSWIQLNNGLPNTSFGNSLAIDPINTQIIYAGTWGGVFKMIQSPDFNIISDPGSQTITPGQSTTYSITVSPVNGFNSTVSLYISGLPSYATYSFSPSSGTPTFTSTLTIYASSSTPTGTYTLTITGTGGGLTRTTHVTLVVESQPTQSIARIEIDRTHRGDLYVEIGVGDFSSTLWYYVVSNYEGGSADNIYETIVTSSASAFFLHQIHINGIYMYLITQEEIQGR